MQYGCASLPFLKGELSIRCLFTTFLSSRLSPHVRHHNDSIAPRGLRPLRSISAFADILVEISNQLSILISLKTVPTRDFIDIKIGI
jgi:hypothetical protein